MAGHKVLVVDDDPAVLKLFRKILERGGYEVLTTESGYNALTTIANEQVSLVILDLSMPAPDGFDLMKFLRSNAPGLRILVVSGYMAGSLLQAAEFVGATATLSKSDAPKLLLQTVNDLLKY